MPLKPLPPGPKLLTPWSVLRLMRAPASVTINAHRRYGDIVKLPFPYGVKLFSVASPELVKQVFTAPNTTVHAGESMLEIVGPLLGANSILTLDGKPHIEQRKRLLPLFGGASVRGQGDFIYENTLREMEAWPVGEPFSLFPYTDRMALGAILSLVFGIHNAQRLETLQALSENFARQAYITLLPNALRRDLGKLSPWGRFLRTRRALDEFIQAEIESRRNEAESEPRNDILSMLMNVRRDDGASMSDMELRDELVTLIFTGQETTATAMAWAVERLLRTPRVLAKLRDSIAAGEDDYLDATVKEVLRARPVVTPFPRKLIEEIEVGGYTLPAGAYVLVSNLAVQQREDLFPDPEKFRPERFLEEKVDNYAWIPFGGGVRRCIGAALAEYEMRIFLQMIVERAELRLPDPGPEGVRLRTTVFPRKGTRIVLDRPLRPALPMPATAPA
ncbi:MAG: cytochrome P450 [Thermoleophilia bacterium]